MTSRDSRLERAAMRLWNSRKAYLKASPHGWDCQGKYWIIRDTAPMREFRRACVAHARDQARAKAMRR